jgi:hypothetical protein
MHGSPNFFEQPRVPAQNSDEGVVRPKKKPRKSLVSFVKNVDFSPQARVFPRVVGKLIS